MIDYRQFFEWPDVQIHHFYLYLVFAAAVAAYLTFKSKSKYKIELFFLSFYLLSGSIQNLLTLKIPGFGLFEIQPIRFIFFLFAFLIIRKTLFSREKLKVRPDRPIPWFEVALLSFVLLLTVSVLVNMPHMGIPDGLKVILDAVAFLALIMALRLMADRASYDLIGKSIIIGAMFSSIVSLIQLSVDPYFLRIGDERLAFGTVLRANGIFRTEYFSSYFLIIAIAWVLLSVKKNWIKIPLVVLFSMGVISSFMRMSWIILALVIVTYLLFVQKVGIGKLVLAGLSGLALVISLSLFFFQDIMNSTVVKERLSDTVGGREGYYAMVFDNIGQNPLFGYGDLKNEVYYTNLMRITGNRDRATATTGDLHSGYFSALFLYGIPAFVCFTLFVLLSVVYYSKALGDDNYFVIPFLVSILYLIGNLTNNFLFLKYISILYALHIGIGMGIAKIARNKTVEE